MLIRVTAFRNNQTKVSLVATVAFICTEAFHVLELGIPTNGTRSFIPRSAQQLRPGHRCWGLQVARGFSHLGLSGGLKEQVRPGFQSLLPDSQADLGQINFLNLCVRTHKSV